MNLSETSGSWVTYTASSAVFKWRLVNDRPSPSVERTSSGKLRLSAAAARVQR